jgi:hypothetical protein
MSFTRFHDDPCRIKKQLQESTGPGRYMINKPGWGANPCFMDDPHIRMEQWGANLQTNTINLESDLLGLTRPLTKDCQTNNYKTAEVKSEPIKYQTCNPFTEESRVTNPAWWYRDLEQNHTYILPLNPQENTCIPFQNNLNTRILEKDYFVAKVPCIDFSSSRSNGVSTSNSNSNSTSIGRTNNIVGSNF